MYSLLRTYHSEATVSLLLDPAGNRICEFLGRPWLNNQKNTLKLPDNNSSCIPEGTYKVTRYQSPTKSPQTNGEVFLINDVQDRSYIEWHPANHIGQLLGCEAPCAKIMENFVYQGKTYKYWAVSSGDTMKKLVKILPKTFIVDIRKG